MDTPVEHTPIRDLFKRLGDEFVALIRSELRLAGGEVRDNLAQAIGAFIALAVGLMLLSVALLCLLGAGVVLLAQFTSLLAAALIVAATAFILGGIAIYVGVTQLKTTSLVPEKLADNLRRDVKVLKGD